MCDTGFCDDDRDGYEPDPDLWRDQKIADDIEWEARQ